MKDLIINILFSVRSRINRIIFPKNGINNSIKPVSSKFGFDRGTPIDRYYIEKYLAKNSHYIKGRILEVGDNRYTQKFGSAVTKSDVVDITSKNKKANIISDLRKTNNLIKSNTYDCIILSHVIGLIDDYEKALLECFRILKKDGVLLVTVASMCPTVNLDQSFWRFTKPSIKFICQKLFKNYLLYVESFGNVRAGVWFWEGYAQEDIDIRVLDFNDERYSCVIGFRVIKK